MLFAENSSVWTEWAGSDFFFSLKFFRILIPFSYKSIQIENEKLYIQLDLTSCDDQHLRAQKIGSTKSIFPKDYHSL